MNIHCPSVSISLISASYILNILIYEPEKNQKKWMRPRGIHSGVQLRYPNISAGMKLKGPNQVWATDFTYIKLR